MSDKVIPVRVGVRIRPMSEKEEDEGCQQIAQVISGRQQIHLASLEKSFTFDYAYDHTASQEDVYSSSVKEMFDKLFSGFNVTVLAYGQTGSGKTHTMGTAFSSETTDDYTEGIIPRAVKDIFSEASRRSGEIDVSIRVAFIELYKEQLYDLLSHRQREKENCVLDIREDPVKGVCIPGLTELEVGTLESTMKQLEKGSNNRVTAATAMNKTSSRSHAIFTLLLNIVSKSDPSNVTVSKFHLVDLAGSERQKKTKAEGQRLNEGININKGLLCLGNVISALGEGGKTHIPYRDSRLTRLLQDSLGGNSYTLMIACISPADSNVEETLSTLRYADRARKIKNKPIVNTNSNDAEVNRLRIEVHELKMQLKNNTGGGTGGGGGGALAAAAGLLDSEEATKLRELNRKILKENAELTGALVSSQQELAHVHEKVMLNETSNEKLKTRLQELIAEVDGMMGNGGLEAEDVLNDFKKKIAAVVELQTEAEKTLMEHEKTLMLNDLSRVDDDSLVGSEEFAEHALKQSALNRQLLDLNKVLSQKEELAKAMASSDEKFQELQNKYAEELRKYEKDLSSAQKEKDELLQQAKNAKHDPTNKIAEQRRKRIQELEGSISDLRKRMVEQQRAIKMNEKNEAQVKKLAEDIRGIKAQKVRLIKQMREDGERVRAWKAAKEKEVAQLRQAERKQAVKMTKMETLHSKQTNVLRAKMEQATALNKRLKDIMDKQKANSKFGKAGGAGNTGAGGLAGAGERLRNWINEEMDVIVTVKEATATRGQLIKDRKTLTQQLNDYKRKMRETASEQEMTEMRKAMEEMNADLELRNAQIQTLQKQITEAENSDANGHGHHVAAAGTGGNSKKVRFESIRTMTEARIVLEHLFEKNVEGTMGAKEIRSEFGELKQIYDESVKNTNALEAEIAGLKGEHETEKISVARDHEEKVLFLLNKLQQKSVGNGEINRIHEAEINQFSRLHDELRKMGEENERLKESQQNSTNKYPAAASSASSSAGNSNNRVGGKKRKSLDGDRYTADEYFMEDTDSDESEGEAVSDEDPDWQKTPLFKRIKKLKETQSFMATAGGANGKKRRLEDGGEGDEEDENQTPESNDDTFTRPAMKRSTSNGAVGGSGGGGGGCGCKTNCANKRCACRKAGPFCGDGCKCSPGGCENREGKRKNSTALGDLTNEGNSVNNDTASTASLLDDTYMVPILKKNPSGANLLKVPTSSMAPQSPVKTRRESYFPSPTIGGAGNLDKKSSMKMTTPEKLIFTTPMRE